MPSFRATIVGVVQGVGFRWFAQRRADKRGVRGFVRNGDRGEVEVVACAEREVLQQFLDELKHGPSASRVDKVDVEWSEEEPSFKEFSVRF